MSNERGSPNSFSFFMVGERGAGSGERGGGGVRKRVVLENFCKPHKGGVLINRGWGWKKKIFANMAKMYRNQGP